MASFDPKTILVVMALPDESGFLFENANVKPLYTGIGQVKAAMSLTQALGQFTPSAVMNFGTAGSFDRAQGHCVECSAFIQRSINQLGPKAKKIPAADVLTNLPKVICGSADFIQHQKFDSITTPFDIMDMEAYALAYVCQQFKVPFYSFKYISDSSDHQVVADWKKNILLAQKELFQVYLWLMNK